MAGVSHNPVDGVAEAVWRQPSVTSLDSSFLKSLLETTMPPRLANSRSVIVAKQKIIRLCVKGINSSTNSRQSSTSQALSSKKHFDGHMPLPF
jgi:hypothetical protein